jgi:predicted metal-binding protein
MLKAVDGGAAVVVCNTCRHSAEQRDDAEGRRGGAQLAAALHTVKARDARFDGVAVQEMPCLFACQEFCTVHLRAPDKVGYVLGRFEPGEEAAQAILDYARAYAASDFGQVPFRDWPAGVKGHFITRTPPPGFVVE